MGSEWQQVRLGEVCKVNPDKRDSTWPYAHVRYIDISSVGTGILKEPPKVIPVSDAPSRAQRLVRDGDTIVSTVRPNRRSFLYMRSPYDDTVVSTGFAVLRAREGLLDCRFLYYLIHDPTFTKYLESRMKGSAYPAVTSRVFDEAEVTVPPIQVQRRIAYLLGTLDDKIELNRRMSRTLERIAAAIFKSWFIDFDPVRAKATGDPTAGGLPAEIADLFPDSFQDSPLGPIPKGWEVGTLDQVLTQLVSGSRPKGGATRTGVPSIGAENVLGLGQYDFSREKFIPEDHFQQLKAKGAAVGPGDVLLYKDGAQIGRKTYFDCDFPHTRCAVNEHVFILRCKERVMQRFLFFWLDQAWVTDRIINLNTGSAQPGINRQGVKTLPILLPDKRLAEAFDREVAPITNRIFRNCHESRTLARLRDALLPKLLSGEVDVSALEGLAEESAQAGEVV